MTRRPKATPSEKLDREIEKQTAFIRKVCLWLWEHRNDEQFSERKYEEGNFHFFDFPDYGGMPKSLSSRLSSDVVDQIQLHQSNLSKVKSPAEILKWFLVI